MASQDMQQIIVKYLTRQTTLSERNELESWLENHDNYEQFKEYVKINYLIDLSMEMFDSNDSKRELLALIDKEKKKIKLRKLYNVMKYAAVFVLIIAAVFHFYPKEISTPSVAVSQSIDNVTLQFENGSIQILDEEGNSKIIDANGNILGFQKGVQLVYEKENPIQKLVYNTIHVPYGKHFKIKLSDGTVVNLNSGSSLKYPVKFIDGENRQVYLTGEAFFNVAKDEKHPFTVNADEVDVRVLGTQFNVSAYPEDEQINTVLVEGSVALYDKNSTKNSKPVTQLKPGYLGSWKKSNSKLTVEKTDTDMATAWIEGRIIFKHVPFGNIVKKLERHYNVEIVNNNSELSDDLITASFDIETIDEVFKVISEIHPITYKIESNKIIINQQ
jgi:transmembrane sensor